MDSIDNCGIMKNAIETGMIKGLKYWVTRGWEDKMLIRIKNFLCLKGSWTWACKMMERGSVIKPKNISGAVKYKLDNENQRRIVWSYTNGETWDNAYIFLSDFECEWELV